MKSIVAVLAMFILLPEVGAQTYTLEQVLAKIDANSRLFKSLDASIERNRVSYLSKDVKGYIPDTDSGKVYFETTGATTPRIKVDITEPKKSEQHVLIDKGWAKVYDRTPNTLTERKVGPNDDFAQMLLLGFGVSSEKIRKTYDVALGSPEQVDGKTTTTVELTAKQVGSQIPKIRLWLDQQTWTPVKTQITQNNRDIQIVKYSKVKLNKPISSSVFKLDLPKDVKKVG